MAVSPNTFFHIPRPWIPDNGRLAGKQERAGSFNISLFVGSLRVNWMQDAANVKEDVTSRHKAHSPK